MIHIKLTFLTTLSMFSQEMRRGTCLGCLPRKTALLLVAFLLWLFFSEVAIYHIYSWQWHWPELQPALDLDKHWARHSLPRGVPVNQPGQRYHYERRDTHYYGTFRKTWDDSQDTKLHVLILSDPHIMCSYAE